MSDLNRVEEMLTALEDHTSTALDDRTLRDMFAAVEQVEEATARRPRWKLYASLAACAAMLLIGAWLARDRPSSPSAQPPQVVDDQYPVLRGERLQREQLLAKDGYAQRDLPGLRRLLSTGLPETQAMAATMLVELGDRGALDLLRTLAASWSGDPGDNPFETAVNRLDILEPNRPVSEPNRAPVDANQVTDTPTYEPETGIAGVVVDELTGEPIVGAEVLRRSSDANGAVTDERGVFKLTGMRSGSRVYASFIAPGYTSKRVINRVEAGQVTQGLRVTLGRGSRVTGEVVDTQGHPVVGAEVATFHFTSRPARTDAQGRYLIDGLNPLVDGYSLQVEHPDYPAFSTRFAPGPVGQTVHLDAVLKPGVTIFGTVRDPAGRPLAGVRVANTTSGAMWNCLRARTDAQGRYELRNVDIGEFVLWAVKEGFAPFVSSTNLTVEESRQRIDIRMIEATPLSGRVLDQAGAPVPNVRAIIDEYEDVRNMDCRRATTDANGLFVLSDAPAQGLLSLRVYGQGVSAETFPVDWTERPLELYVTRAGRIYGQVVDIHTDEPLNRFKVKMTFSQVETSPGGYSASWNREGHSFENEAGEFDTGSEDLAVGGAYCMTVMAEGYDRVTLDPVWVQAIAAEPDRTLFQLRPATALARRVVDPEGNPVPDAVIGVFAETERSDPSYWARFATDEQGIFVLSGLGEDQRYVQITAPGFANHLCYRADLGGDDASADVILVPGATLVGAVTDPAGHPYVDVQVRVRQIQTHGLDLPFGARSVRTDERGRYLLTEVPVGALEVSFESFLRERLARKTCTVQAGETLELNLNQEEGLVLSGSIHERGVPRADVDVRFEVDNREYFGARTDRQGTFRIPGITVDRGELSVHHTDNYNDDYRQRVTLPQARDIEIDLAGLTLQGRLPALHHDREDLRLIVRRWSEDVNAERRVAGQWINDHRAGRTVDITPEGGFTCGRLEPGHYYLILRHAGQDLAITDEFELSVARPMPDPEFRTETGSLRVQVLDASSHQPVAGAACVMANEGQWPGGQGRVDERGEIAFAELLHGRYQATVTAPKYLPVQSEWIAIDSDSTVQTTVLLHPAAMATFVLSERLKARIGTRHVVIRCRVTDLASESLVLPLSPWDDDIEHGTSMPLSGEADETTSLLELPAGSYRLQYRVRPYDVERRVIEGACYEGAATVDLTTGQVTSIPIGD